MRGKGQLGISSRAAHGTRYPPAEGLAEPVSNRDQAGLALTDHE